MISGALPALLIFFIRLFVPESKKWEHEKARGATSHWSNVDLIGVTVGCLASIAIIWSWSPAGTGPADGRSHHGDRRRGRALGISFPGAWISRPRGLCGSLAPHQQRVVIRHMLLEQALAGVALLGTWGSIQWAPRWAFQLEPDPRRFSREYTQIASALGAIVFPIIAGVVAGSFGRRITYAVLCMGSIASAAPLSGATTSSTPFSSFVRFWPVVSRRLSMVGFLCICLSSFRPPFARPGKVSRTTSAAFLRRLEVFKPQRSWASSAAALRRRARC